MIKAERIVLFILILFNQSCISTEKKIQCLDAQMKIWCHDEVYKDIRSNLERTIISWIDSGIRIVQHLQKEKWKVDNNVYFNSSKNAALLLILVQDTANEAYIDDIKLVYAKKINNNWRFFYQTMPVIGIQRYYKKIKPEEPSSFKELSDIAKKKIIKGGYFKLFSCEINDKYIEEWYTLKNLEKNHLKFMKDKIPKQQQ